MSCSVCGDGRQSMGGFLLWERNGKISAICNDCWFSFTNASPNSRVARTDAQKAALMERIGVEPQLFYKALPFTKTFQENLSEAITRLQMKSRLQENPLQKSVQCNTVQVS